MKARHLEDKMLCNQYFIFYFFEKCFFEFFWVFYEKYNLKLQMHA